MTDVKMDSDLPFSDFIDPFSITEIVSSKTFKEGKWRSLTSLKDFKNGISKSVFPVDISRFKILVLTNVVARRLIRSHSHDDPEPMFRYIVAGSFKLNGETYSAGDWVIVPIGQSYEIYTEDGYGALQPYGMSCSCSAVGGH